MKAGVLPRGMEKRLSKVSAYAEACGYAANIALNVHRLGVMRLQEAALLARLEDVRRRAGEERRQRQLAARRTRKQQHQEQQDGAEATRKGEAASEMRFRGQCSSSEGGAAATRAAAADTEAGDGGADNDDGGGDGGDEGEGGEPPEAAEISRQIASLRSQRVLRSAFVVQDCADGLLALADITDGRYERVSHPVVLAVAGLVSAAVSSYKNWG